MVTKNQKKQSVVPELRFPEFQCEQPWQESTLDNTFSSIKNGITSSQNTGKTGYRVTRIETISDGFINLERTGFADTKENISRYRLHIGDILISHINSVEHIGKTAFVDRDYDLYHGMNLLRLVPERSQFDPRFLFCLLNTSSFRSIVRSRANKAVNQASINQTDLGKVQVIIPKLAEQQKIADCLGSLDDLIAAHSRKLAALQDHKKGLLQQLFPAEGETTPKLRFPEFEGSGEWEATSLDEACLMKAGKFVKAAEIKAEPECDTYPCYGGNGLRGYTTTHTHNGRYSLIGRQGALCGNVQLASGCFHATEHAVVADPRKNVKTDWLFYALLLLNLNQYATGQAQPGLSVEVLNRVPLAIPKPPEQQKIADCLSALDALITAQTEQIDALKEHKKGLMQQLFPIPD